MRKGKDGGSGVAETEVTLLFLLFFSFLRTELPDEASEGPFFRNKFGICTALRNSAIENGIDIINLREEVEGVSHENTGLAWGGVEEDVVENSWRRGVVVREIVGDRVA